MILLSASKNFLSCTSRELLTSGSVNVNEVQPNKGEVRIREKWDLHCNRTNAQ